MVLERLVSVRTAIRHPTWMFIIGGFVSIISILIAFWVFPSSVGMLTVFLITIIMTPFMINLMKYEEYETEEEFERKIESNFFKRHTDVLKIYAAFFLGMIFAMSILFLILPGNTVEKIFEDQINEINIIKGNVISPSNFQKIVLNNISVMTLCFLFAFLFGSGAIFILAWNASVLSAAIGVVAKSIGGISGMSTAVMTFLPHGTFEILAYFVAGIAGGLVSVVITKRRNKLFWVVIKDSFKLMGVAALFLIIGAVIEAGILSF